MWLIIGPWKFVNERPGLEAITELNMWQFSYCACSNSSFWVGLYSSEKTLVQELRGKRGDGRLFKMGLFSWGYGNGFCFAKHAHSCILSISICENSQLAIERTSHSKPDMVIRYSLNPLHSTHTHTYIHYTRDWDIGMPNYYIIIISNARKMI